MSSFIYEFPEEFIFECKIRMDKDVFTGWFDITSANPVAALVGYAKVISVNGHPNLLHFEDNWYCAILEHTGRKEFYLNARATDDVTFTRINETDIDDIKTGKQKIWFKFNYMHQRELLRIGEW